MEQERMKPVELAETCEIELSVIDLKPHIGKDTKIEKVTEMEGQFGYMIKVETAVIETLNPNSNKPIELRGSRLFGLQTDADGMIGWGKDTKLGVHLKNKGVDHYKKLIGLDVKLQVTTNKQGKEFLSYA